MLATSREAATQQAIRKGPTRFILLFGLAGIVISAGGNALLGAMGLWVLAGRSVYIGVFERLASAILLVLAGAYMISYWWSSLTQGEPVAEWKR